MTNNPLIVALDCDREEALAIADSLTGSVEWLKVGMTLYYQCGPAIVKELSDKGFKVFLDLKLHDIPHQVYGAAHSLARSGAAMITVHGCGGPVMMQAALEGATAGAQDADIPRPAVIAITVLTSMDAKNLQSVGVDLPLEQQVGKLALLAKDAGLDGIVCSPLEAEAMRELLGGHALLVTPGVRPDWANNQDQSRVATPAEALRSGATQLVIGRPITEASDPKEAADLIVSELKGAY